MEQQNDGQLNVAEQVSNIVAEISRPKRTKKDTIINIVLIVSIVILALTLIMRMFVISTIKVDGDSMLPTFYTGNTIFVNKTVKPERGDVVVFYKRNIDSKFKALFASKQSRSREGQYALLVKRVVALGGDKIWVEEIDYNRYKVFVETPDGILTENYYTKKGVLLEENTFYISTSLELAESRLGNLRGRTRENPLVISEGNMFVMGDNRSNSADSRGSLGEVPLDRLFGVMIDK